MATWARGVDFKNSTNTTRVGGIGIYGTDATTNKLYIGLGAEPWNNAGLQLTSSAINFKGSKIYHAGDKPTASEIGAAAASHNHTSLTSVTSIGGAGASSSWGSLNIAGSKGGWAGVHFSDMGYIWMVKNDGYTGMWKNGGNPVFAFDANGALATGSVGWDKITGKPSTYTPSSHNHSMLTGINDTRTTEYTPATARNEFKATFQKNGTNGVNDGGSWYTLMHIPRYPDASGGFGSQMALTDNENIWYRKGTSDTAWTGWKKIWHSGNFDPNSKANSSHAHNYAGSSSAGGAATTALACTGNSATATTSNYLASNTRMDYGWNGINYFNISGTAGNVAKANDTPTTAWWHVMRFNHSNSTGYYTDLAIPFNDTSLYYKRITSGAVQNGGWVRVLDSLNYNSYAPTKTGGGASGTWGISVSGNANTATTLQNARTINGTSFNGAGNITTANWGTARTITIGSTGKSVNGSINVSWSLAEIGAAASSHTHSYLPLSGGTVTGRLTANGKISIPTTGSSWISGKTLTNASIAIATKQTTGSYHPILAVQSSSDHVVNIGGLGDNFGFYGYKSTRTDNGTDWSFTFNASNGAVSSTGNITAPVFAGNLQGNATTATSLQNARTINGTSFNGSGNITTANWGTARTLTIGNTGKSVNGSTNVSWSLSEIGAAAASHTHSYLPLSGGTLTGALTSKSDINLNGGKLYFGNSSGGNRISVYSDGVGGINMFTNEGAEINLSRKGYFTGIYGFYNDIYIEKDTSPSITLTPFTNPNDNTGGRIIFNSTDNQNVQLRHEWYDGVLPPFGLIIEKAPGNNQKHNAGLKVEGAIQCGVNASFINNTNSPDARIVRGETDNAGGLKVQMGGTNTTASFEVVNPGWNTAWFSCGNTGIRSNSYSNFSDEKLKTNIEEVNYSISDKMNKIKIYNYNYLSDYNRVIPSIVKRDIKCKTTAITKLKKANNYKISLSSKTDELYEDVPEKRWGVIAQEVEELFPELITEAETLIDGENKLVKSVDVYGLTVLTLEFAKEIAKENQTLKEELKLIKEKLGL